MLFLLQVLYIRPLVVTPKLFAASAISLGYAQVVTAEHDECPLLVTYYMTAF
jgi:hypothetical protein